MCTFDFSFECSLYGGVKSSHGMTIVQNLNHQSTHSDLGEKVCVTVL